MGRPWGKRKELLQQMGAGSFEYGGSVRLPNGRSAYVVLRDGKPFKRYYNHDKAMQFLDLRRDDMEGRAMRKRYNPLPAANVAESDLGAEVVRTVVAKAGDEEVIDEFAERWQNVIDSGKSTRKEQVAQRYFISKFRQLYQQGKIKGQKAKVAYAITQAAAYRVMLEDGRLTGVEAISDPLVREMFIGADGTLIPLGRDQHNRASPLVKVRDALKRGIRTSAVDWLSPHVPFPSEPKSRTARQRSRPSTQAPQAYRDDQIDLSSFMERTRTRRAPPPPRVPPIEMEMPVVEEIEVESVSTNENMQAKEIVSFLMARPQLAQTVCAMLDQLRGLK
jgi:hypothetical protein